MQPERILNVWTNLNPGYGAALANAGIVTWAEFQVRRTVMQHRRLGSGYQLEVTVEIDQGCLRVLKYFISNPT